MYEKRFEILHEAYQLLNWEEQAASLENLRRIYEARQYFVVFTGQFSAGKSCLINNPLGKEILPTGVRETTSLLTYIQYSVNEYALVHFIDSSVSQIPLKEVHTIFQNSPAWDLEKLEYLEIFVCSDILRSGMIFMDTPGINSRIYDKEQEPLRQIKEAIHNGEGSVTEQLSSLEVALKTYMESYQSYIERFSQLSEQDIQFINILMEKDNGL